MNIEKRCPDCGGNLVIRTNSYTDEQFVACSQYPNCKHTEPIPESVKMRAAGAVALPGFD